MGLQINNEDGIFEKKCKFKDKIKTKTNIYDNFSLQSYFVEFNLKVYRGPLYSPGKGGGGVPVGFEVDDVGGVAQPRLVPVRHHTQAQS